MSKFKELMTIRHNKQFDQFNGMLIMILKASMNIMG